MIVLSKEGGGRLTLSEYVGLCTAHLRKYWKRYTAPVLVLVVMQLFIRVDVNYTASLPDHVFITVKGWKSGIGYGDYVAYRFPTENPASPFRKGDHMVKIVVGQPGDQVVIDEGRVVSIIHPEKLVSRVDEIPGSPPPGYRYVGVSKSFSKAGKPLEAIAPGVIPEGRFFAWAPHPDSLDSRYKMVGFIAEDDILGRSFPIF